MASAGCRRLRLSDRASLRSESRHRWLSSGPDCASLFRSLRDIEAEAETGGCILLIKRRVAGDDRQAGNFPARLPIANGQLYQIVNRLYLFRIRAPEPA